MSTGYDEIDNRINDLAEQENECLGLFDQIKNGKGENSSRYVALRGSCNELRREIFRAAISAGLTRERIKAEIMEARRNALAQKQSVVST